MKPTPLLLTLLLPSLLYAEAGVTAYWIINLVDRLVESYTHPSGAVSLPTYRQRKDFAPGDSIPLEVPGAPPTLVSVADLLP